MDRLFTELLILNKKEAIEAFEPSEDIDFGDSYNDSALSHHFVQAFPHTMR